jgi:hypothetical protein
MYSKRITETSTIDRAPARARNLLDAARAGLSDADRSAAEHNDAQIVYEVVISLIFCPLRIASRRWPAATVGGTHLRYRRKRVSVSPFH